MEEETKCDNSFGLDTQELGRIGAERAIVCQVIQHLIQAISVQRNKKEAVWL